MFQVQLCTYLKYYVQDQPIFLRKFTIKQLKSPKMYRHSVDFAGCMVARASFWRQKYLFLIGCEGVREAS